MVLDRYEVAERERSTVAGHRPLRSFRTKRKDVLSDAPSAYRLDSISAAVFPRLSTGRMWPVPLVGGGRSKMSDAKERET